MPFNHPVRRYRIDDRQASQAIEAEEDGRKDTTDGGSRGRDERAVGPQVAVWPVVVGDQAGALVADPADPFDGVWEEEILPLLGGEAAGRLKGKRILRLGTIMRVHQLVLEHLHKNILPYVFQVQDMSVPYPAELWEGGNCKSETGSVMFNINGSRLTAEYFDYDVRNPYLSMQPGFDDDSEWKIVLKITQVEIPVRSIQESRKAHTVFGGVMTPPVKAYECDIKSWVGDPNSKIRSAVITITGLPSLHMPRGSFRLPAKKLGDSLTQTRTDTRTPVLTLEGGDWRIALTEVFSEPSEETGIMHTASLRRVEDSPFTLGDEESVVVALRQFLSFQAGGWINLPTIVCLPSEPKDWIVKRAFVGKLSSRSPEQRSQGTATDFRDWPKLFKEFWKRHTRNTKHLNNAIHHYVTCSEIFENDYEIDFAIVAAKSTLESLIRWWNGLDEEYEFHGEPDHQFVTQLMKAVEKAELGRDVGSQIDTEEVSFVIDNASRFRNRIDHGRAGNVDADEMRRIIAHQQYMHNLARLLILAKFGLRNTDARGSFYSPRFKKATEYEKTLMPLSNLLKSANRPPAPAPSATRRPAS